MPGYRNGWSFRSCRHAWGRIPAFLMAFTLAASGVLPGCSWFSKSKQVQSPSTPQAEPEEAVLPAGSAEPEASVSPDAPSPVQGAAPVASPAPEAPGASAADSSETEGGDGDAAGAASGNQDPFQAAVQHMQAGPASYPEALEQLDEALSLNPRLAEAYYDKGVIHQELGELSDAVKAYQDALEIKPTLAAAAANLATIYRDQGQYALSIEVLDSALAASPESPLLRRQRALSLERMGRVSEATEEIRKILKKNAIDVDAFVSLGCMYLRQGDYEMGRLVFEKALLSVPEATENAYVHHNLGVAFLGLGDRRAAAEFDSALGVKPDLVPALINRAYLYLRIQNFEAAEALLRRAVAVEPRNVVARLDLGVALRGLEKYDEAAGQYEAALKLDAANPVVLLNYGILLDDYKRDYAGAIDVYQRLKDTLDNEEELKKVEKYIRIAKLNLKREERRRKRERERAKQQEEADANPGADNAGRLQGDSARTPVQPGSDDGATERQGQPPQSGAGGGGGH